MREPSKYRNKITVVDGIKFGSKKEANRWQELRLLERAGKICELKRQVSFELAPRVQFTGERETPALRYVADFTYSEEPKPYQYYWRYVVEDSKGMRTPAYKIKRHLMLAVHKIEVLET